MDRPPRQTHVHVHATSSLQPGDRVIITMPDPGPDKTHWDHLEKVAAELKARWPDVDLVFIAGGTCVVANAAGASGSLGKAEANARQERREQGYPRRTR